MFKNFKNFAQMFCKILLNYLNMQDQVEHSIDFVNRKTLRIDCVYNMLQDNFIAFRNYIVNALKKN